MPIRFKGKKVITSKVPKARLGPVARGTIGPRPTGPLDTATQTALNTQRLQGFVDSQHAPSAPSAPTPTTSPIQPNAPADLNAELSSGVINPNDALKFSSYNPASGQPDPRDASYWENVNKLLFDAQQGYGKNIAEQQLADVNWGAEQEQMQTDRQRSERSMAEQMIRNNLSDSGFHDRSQAEATQDFVTRLGGATRQKSSEDAARAAAQHAILAGFSIDEAAAMAEAAGRYAAQKADEAQNAAGDTPNVDAAGGGDAAGAGGGGGGNKKKKDKKDKKKNKRPTYQGSGSLGPYTPPGMFATTPSGRQAAKKSKRRR